MSVFFKNERRNYINAPGRGIIGKLLFQKMNLRNEKTGGESSGYKNLAFSSGVGSMQTLFLPNHR